MASFLGEIRQRKVFQVTAVHFVIHGLMRRRNKVGNR